MSNDRPELDEAAITGPLRMQLALARFPAAAPPLDERFLQWMAARLDRASGTGPAGLGMSFSTDHDRVAWWARTGAPNPGPVGSDGGGIWIAADADFEDEGWFATGSMPVAAAFDSGPAAVHEPSRQVVERWAETAGTDVGTVAWCTAPAHPFATVSFVLPGDDTVEQMMVGLDLFDDIGVDGPPQSALAPILNAPGPLSVVVSLVPDGLRSAGFFARDLGSDRLVQLLVAIDPSTVTPSGETLGVLGVDDPAAVTAQNTTAGPQAIIHARIAT